MPYNHRAGEALTNTREEMIALKEEIAADVSWKIFRGDRVPREIKEWPAPPPWRDFHRIKDNEDRGNPGRGKYYIADDDQIEMVNAALHLRRPLLVRGKPGAGKSSLAYAVAYELGLGPVLRWPITSRSTLQEGLYRYDAIDRLRDANLEKTRKSEAPNIGNYLSLGPLGTAFLDSETPRVLLIDEIDKGDIDLPNDLLNIFEEGEFEVPELARYKEPVVDVQMYESKDMRPIEKGRVKCKSFPFVVMTSNEEREFPPPLMRRCLCLNIKPPEDKNVLADMIKRHFDEEDKEIEEEVKDLISRFIDRRRTEGHMGTDQLFSAVFLLTRGLEIASPTKNQLEEKILQVLGDSDGR
jgi:MoxR-like ATPase